MKLKDMKGWREVFGFTLQQNLKTRGTIIFLAIIAVLSIGFMPVVSLINGNGKDKTEKSDIAQLCVFDETEYHMVSVLEKLMEKDKSYPGIKITEPKGNLEEAREKLNQAGTDCKDVFVIVKNTEQGLSMHFEYGENSALGLTDMQTFVEHMESIMGNMKEYMAELSEQQAELLHMEIHTKTIVLSKQDLKNPENYKESEKKESMTLGQYELILGICTLLTLAIQMAAEGVASQIVTEKSSKIVEVLMTSVRPMAIIVGKVLGSVCTMLIELGTFIVGGGISFLLNGMITGSYSKENLPGFLKNLLNGEMANTSPFKLFLGVVTLCLGVLFFSLFAGLVGSTISKLEEMAEGMKLYTFLLLAGCYFTIFTAIMSMGGNCPKALEYVCCILPISSSFALPGYILTGLAPTWVMIVAIVVLFISLILLFYFTSAIYEEVLYYQGEKMTVKNMITIFKGKRKEAKHE